jgi:hypothetical protein
VSDAPSDQTGNTGSPADTTGDDVVIPGEAPHDTPPDAAEQKPPGGAPSEGSGVPPAPPPVPVLERVTPDTVAVGTTGNVITVTGDGKHQAAGSARVWIGGESKGEFSLTLTQPLGTATFTLDTNGWAPGDGVVDVVVTSPTGFSASNQLPFHATGVEEE